MIDINLLFILYKSNINYFDFFYFFRIENFKNKMFVNYDF